MYMCCGDACIVHHLLCERHKKPPACFLLRGVPTLRHLKILLLYLDVPLRCISLGLSGADEQREEGDPALSLCG